MKKTILLLFFIFCITGCYDYKEINNLAIVSEIAIDYIDNNYLLNMKILENSDKQKYKYISSSGKNLNEAFINANYRTNKVLFYSHLNKMILSQKAVNDNLYDIIDYIIRNPDIDNKFDVVISNYSNLEELLKKDNSSIAKISFEELAAIFFNNKNDLYIPTITIEDDEVIEDTLAIFSKNKFKEILNTKESQILLMLLNKKNEVSFTIECDNGNTTIKIYNQSISLNKNYIKIHLKATVVQNSCNFDLQNKNDINKLTNIANKEITNDVDNLIRKLQNNNSDVLGINYNYYKNYNKVLDFKNEDIKTKISLSINKNGLIFGGKK